MKSSKQYAGNPTPYNGNLLQNPYPIKSGNKMRLNQNELNTLTKQKNLKNRLKNNCNTLDSLNTGTVHFDKFQNEAKDLGIYLS